MYYTILPNPVYIISTEGLIKRADGKKLDLTIKNNIVNIELYGTVYNKSVDWLIKLALNKISLPYECHDRIGDITFRTYGKQYGIEIRELISTREPIIFMNKYAIAPNYPTFAISNDGEVVDVHTKKIIKKCKSNLQNEYITYNIHGRIFRLHRVIMEAWVWNDDPKDMTIINHIDGNKANSIMDNLEWCTFSRNIKHAIETGLRTDNIYTKIRNRDTKLITEFYSIADMCIYLKIAPIDSNRLLKLDTGKLIKNHEVRITGDTRDWYYINGDEPIVPYNAMYKYVLNLNGKVMHIYKYSDVNKILGYPVRLSTADIFDKIKNDSRDITLDIIDLVDKRSFQAIHHKTLIVTEGDTSRDLANKLNTPDSTVARGCSLPENRVIGEYAYRRKTDTAWDTNFVYNNLSPRKIKITDIYTNETSVFPSLVNCAVFMLVTSKTLKRYLDNNIILKNKKLEEI